jgi:transcriptional regulator with XRE-family HTH domain
VTAPAENVYSLIVQSGQSMRALETAAGFGRNTLSRILSGRHPARRSTVERLARVVGADPDAMAASLVRSRESYLARLRARGILGGGRG